MVMYALHNAELQRLAGSNAAIAKKYTFMRDRVFGPDFEPVAEISALNFGHRRTWDTTKLAHNLVF